MGLTTQTYDIVTRIAVGNGAIVYRAVEKSTLRQVAVKLLTQEGAVDHRFDLDALFEAGPQIRKITGAHVCQLLDAYRDEDGPVLVYEFANGINGSDFPHEKQLDNAQALDVAAQLISSLRSGERQRTPHGDLKPSNIVFVEAAEGRPYTFVLDWGLAAFRTDTPEDSLPFFAPERLAGARESHKADLFSAGAVLFYLLTAKMLVGGTTREELSHAWMGVRPEILADLRPDLNPKLVQWICSLLAVDPAMRPASAVEAGTALAALNPPPPLVPPETIRPRPAPRIAAIPPPPPREIVSTATSPVQRQSAGFIPPTRTPPAPPKKSSGAIVALISLFGAAALAVGAWWFLKDHQPEDPSASHVLPQPRTPPPSVMAPVQEPPPPIPQPVAEKAALASPAPVVKQAPVDPNVFISERFEHPPGTAIAGIAGGNGWAGPWQGSGGAVVRQSLDFPRYPAVGGSLALAPAKAEQSWTRLAGPLSVFVRNAAKGDRWFLGMLIKHGDGTPAPNGELQINPFDIADPFNLARIIVEDAGPMIRVSLNDPKVFLEIPDDGKPIYILTRIDLTNPKLGNWDVDVALWVNPAFDQTTELKAGKSVAIKLPYAQLPPDLGLLIRRKRTQTESGIDEIRFGRLYEHMVFK